MPETIQPLVKEQNSTEEFTSIDDLITQKIGDIEELKKNISELRIDDNEKRATLLTKKESLTNSLLKIQEAMDLLEDDGVYKNLLAKSGQTHLAFGRTMVQKTASLEAVIGQIKNKINEVETSIKAIPMTDVELANHYLEMITNNPKALAVVLVNMTRELKDLRTGTVSPPYLKAEAGSVGDDDETESGGEPVVDKKIDNLVNLEAISDKERATLEDQVEALKELPEKNQNRVFANLNKQLKKLVRMGSDEITNLLEYSIDQFEDEDIVPENEYDTTLAVLFAGESLGLWGKVNEELVKDQTEEYLDHIRGLSKSLLGITRKDRIFFRRENKSEYKKLFKLFLMLHKDEISKSPLLAANEHLNKSTDDDDDLLEVEPTGSVAETAATPKVEDRKIIPKEETEVGTIGDDEDLPDVEPAGPVAEDEVESGEDAMSLEDVLQAFGMTEADLEGVVFDDLDVDFALQTLRDLAERKVKPTNLGDTAKENIKVLLEGIAESQSGSEKWMTEIQKYIQANV